MENTFSHTTNVFRDQTRHFYIFFLSQNYLIGINLLETDLLIKEKEQASNHGSG